jgi:hypothetical protein
MLIPTRVRPKSYREVNGDEIVLGANGAIGYISPVVWAKSKGSPADGPDILLQFELTARLNELLQSDPKLQDILERMAENARLNKSWEEAEREPDPLDTPDRESWAEAQGEA